VRAREWTKEADAPVERLGPAVAGRTVGRLARALGAFAAASVREAEQGRHLLVDEGRADLDEDDHVRVAEEEEGCGRTESEGQRRAKLGDERILDAPKKPAIMAKVLAVRVPASFIRFCLASSASDRP
jgi:hypothetical protein